jgi:hypothetical protein
MSRVLSFLYEDQMFGRRDSAAIGCGLFLALMAVIVRNAVCSALHSIGARFGGDRMRPALGGV